MSPTFDMLVIWVHLIDPLQKSPDKFTELEGPIVVRLHVFRQARVKTIVLYLYKV